MNYNKARTVLLASLIAGLVITFITVDPTNAEPEYTFQDLNNDMRDWIENPEGQTLEEKAKELKTKYDRLLRDIIEQSRINTNTRELSEDEIASAMYYIIMESYKEERLQQLRAAADIPSPLAQYDSGVPVGEIQCRDSRVLMETIRGTPACVYEKSVERLQQNGWVFIPTKMITIGNYDKMPDKTHSELYLKFWPEYTVTFPEQVRVGEKFQVILDYTFVTPSVSYDGNGKEVLDYENPLEICNQECMDNWDYIESAFFIIKNEYVTIQDPDYVLVDSWDNTAYTPVRAFNYGTIEPVYDNTEPQQKILTFKIGKPDTNYPIGKIRIDFNGDLGGLINFYIAPSGNIAHLSSEPIDFDEISQGRETVTKLVRNWPQGSTLTPSSDPLDSIHDVDQLMSDLAEWIREAYLPDRIDQIEPDFRESNFPDWFIEKFFNMYPDLKAQSFMQSSWFVLPSAYGQTPASFEQNLGEWYIVLSNSEVSSGDLPGVVGTISAQNTVLDGHGPAYSIGTGGDSGLFSITSGNEMRMVSTAPGTYTVTITATGTSVFEDGNNELELEVTVGGN